MNLFDLNANVGIVLAVVGAVFGLIAQVLLWIYMVAAVRGVNMPDYGDFRRNVNLAYLFSALLLSFVCLTAEIAAEALAQNLLIIQLGCWMVTCIGAVVMLAVRSSQRERINSALGAGLFKLVLTALVLWVIA